MLTMLEKQARFHLYRYQLLPKDRYFQGDLYGASSVDELIEKKNSIFSDILTQNVFKGVRTEVSVQKIFEKDNLFLYKLAANRSINRETRDFKVEQMDNWPKVLLAVWNDPEKQLIAVQHRYAAFQKTDSVMNMLFNSIEQDLSKFQLNAIWDPLFEKNVFWDLIEAHRGQVQEIEFEIITPNMANISGSIADNLKDLAKQSNSIKNKISMLSDASSSLNIAPDNNTVSGLVDYASEGGGDISVRIKGMSKKIHTSKTIKEVSIAEAELIGDPEGIAKILRGLLS
jgi:hypothetical protein